MNVIQTVVLTFEEEKLLFDLWNTEYPEKIGYDELSEFQDYLKELSNKKYFLLVDDLKQLKGWAFTFEREGEDWFGIVIESDKQGKGFGTLLLDELKKYAAVLYGWVIDHQKDLKRNKKPYLSPLSFYTKYGFEVDENIRLENDKISAVKIRWERA